MCLRRKKKGKSKVVASEFSLRDSQAKQKVLQSSISIAKM